MRIIHLNCGCMCPIGGMLFDGYSSGIINSHLVCHCLLIESNNGLILIDTGFGIADVTNPHSRLSNFFLNFNRIKLKEENTALYQIRKLGFSAKDVRHIILTHLDFDHAGGLSDFPDATVHIMDIEVKATRKRNTSFLLRNRYRPQQWENVKKWELYSSEGEKWFGFEAVRSLVGVPEDILFIPLVGHTEGHAGIAINVNGQWILHAGDAYFYHGEVKSSRRKCPLGMRFYQWMMEVDRSKRLHNQDLLRNLITTHNNEIEVFCSHDATELAKYT